MRFERGARNPIGWDQDFFVKPAVVDSVICEIVCNVFEFSSDQRLAVGERFEKNETKAFGDRAGDEVGGVGDP